MSSILIKGMTMPTYEQGDLVLRIRWDGRVDKDYSGNTVATAVPVPPHGRLIDADAFESIKYELPDGQKAFNRGFHSGVQYVQRLIMDASTVIEAEEGET